MVMERNDINANQMFEKEINSMERKQQNNQNNNNNSNSSSSINSKRVSSVSVSRLNVNYLKETASSSSASSAAPYIISTNNSLFNNNNNNREKTFSFGKMNKSINNSNSITNLNDKNSPFQFIKAQLAYKHYEILYKPKNFRAGILPVEENSDYTNIQLENNRKKMNLNLKNNSLTKIKPNSSRFVPIISNTNKKINVSNKKLNESKSNPSNSNDLTSSSLTKLDYVKSIVANNSSNSSKLNNEETQRIQATTANNSKKLESLYQNIPSLLPYLNRRYDNEFGSLPNQPSFLLNYKQSGSPHYHSLNDMESSTLSFKKGFKINTAAPKNWLKLKYSGARQDCLNNHHISKTNFLVTNQS